MAFKPPRREIVAIPERVQRTSTLCRDGRKTQRLQRLLWRIVGMMRVHQVNPKKERLVSLFTQPSGRSVDQNVGRGVPTQLIHGNCLTTRAPLAITKIEFIVNSGR